MTAFYLYLGIYCLGCVLAMVYFLVGRATALAGREWSWPVIFLWPLVAFWPVYAFTGLFLKRPTQKQK